MPPPKPKKRKTPSTKAAAPGAAPNLPTPERVPKARVGEVVQDFVSFGGATVVEARQQDGDTWLITAIA